jgi:hypothetical protein
MSESQSIDKIMDNIRGVRTPATRKGAELFRMSCPFCFYEAELPINGQYSASEIIVKGKIREHIEYQHPEEIKNG